MMLVVKAVVSGLLIALASEMAKRSPLWGSVLVSIPLTSLLTAMWIHIESADLERNAVFLRNVFWAHLPTLTFFILCPIMLRQGINFWVSIFFSLAVTAAVFFAYAAILRHFGIRITE
ncbi:MAG: DUF3147 family protein [Alphaproteobacteria bacterium]|nr:DUF3147 family protein [Alphaproteobacteria bacterium]